MGDIAKEKERLRQECALARARLKSREKDEKIAERFFASPFFAYRSFFCLPFRSYRGGYGADHRRAVCGGKDGLPAARRGEIYAFGARDARG